MQHLLYQIGLPRTGTTSSGAALHELGYRQRHLIVSNVDWGGGRFQPYNLPNDDRPVLMAFRPRDEWLVSVSGYRPHVATIDLKRIYADHMEWYYSLQRPVGVYDVRKGWEGLVRALDSIGAPHLEPPALQFPHLNQSPPADKLRGKSAANG